MIIISQEEMKDLTEDLDNKLVKGLQHKIDVYVSEIYDLKSTITKKDEEIKKLEENVDNLKSQLEHGSDRLPELERQVEELNTIKEHMNNELTSLNSQVDELSKKTEELNNSLSEKNSRLDELITTISKKDAKIDELIKLISEKDTIIEDQKASLIKTETELEALKPEAPTEYMSEERLICPNCGSVGKDIKSEEDKSKVLGYIGHSPMYAKKHVCKKCGYEF